LTEEGKHRHPPIPALPALRLPPDPFQGLAEREGGMRNVSRKKKKSLPAGAGKKHLCAANNRNHVIKTRFDKFCS
jgi:hypothetical protein